MPQTSEISELSPYFLDQFSDNRIFRDLLRGLAGVRGTKSSSLVTGSGGSVKSPYLPQFDAEPNNVYTQRLNRSFLTNYYKRAIESDSGKILASPVQAKQDDGQDLPDEYSAWLDNVDLEGMPVDVLAKQQLQAAQAKGVTLCYVDFITDEQRPFIHEIDIDEVLSFKTDSRTGRLTFLRWKSSIIKDSDDDSVMVDNNNVIFEVTPTTWALYDEDDQSTPAEAGEIIRYVNGSTRITNEIPVSIFYTNKEGLLLADSPYRPLAEMTIEHFQVRSDVKNMMFYALQPILFAKGMPEDFSISALASYIMVKAPEGLPDADLNWVQVDSSAINQARLDIQDLEQRIAAFGVDSNSIRPSGNRTATQSAIDSAGSNAALKMFAQGLSEHIERIIEMMSSYTLSPIVASVEITPDFNLADNNEKSQTAVNAFDKNLISGKAATDILIQNNVLPKDYDYDLDAAAIRESSAMDGLM